VLLVVLFHAGVKPLSGGYVGVDVFFVISGFVITGVLLRERAGKGSTSLLSFYAARCRRILPTAAIVLIATMLAAYFVLGEAAGVRTADDGAWAAVFLANFHFASNGTNYLLAELPPSPLQNFWTLSVEEQFYVVFPTLFLIVAAWRHRFSLRTRMLGVLALLVIVSLVWSVLQTGSDPNSAYFSPFTRAWELALGAMVSLATPGLARLPGLTAAAITWLGLVMIVIAGFAFNQNTPYPGWVVMVPVVGAALVIAGGTATPRSGAESVLGLSPFRLLGRVSYSLYLWHWPILILAAEAYGRTSLPLTESLAWLLVALALSVVTYRLVENPIRHSVVLRRRSAASVGLGAALVVTTLVVALTLTSPGRATPLVSSGARSGSSADMSTVEKLVNEAPAIKTVPTDLQPPLQSTDLGYPSVAACLPLNYPQTSMAPCAFGDPHGSRTMVLYGDSHSGMWFQTIDAIAIASHWTDFPHVRRPFYVPHPSARSTRLISSSSSSTSSSVNWCPRSMAGR